MPMNKQDINNAVSSGNVAVIGSCVHDPCRRHITGSTPSPCAECDRSVILSPATRRRMTDLTLVLCTDCAVAVAEARNEPWIHPGRNDDQLREMVANGIEPERWYGGNKTTEV